MSRPKVTIDGNEAAAYVAHHLSEVIAIYPITPSSPMGEWADTWSAKGQKNIWGTIPDVTEMQSEGGAAGAIHGALQAGALCTTFTASQGLLLMIPNMYKIAGELTSAVFHVSARSLATQALSIFGDHSDVMSCRQTGFAMLASGSIQEVMDNALIAHNATLASRIPFMHFFDGFRTSHELMKVEKLTEDDMRQMIDDELVIAHRDRALSPDKPKIRGTAQNPDVYFQGRETVNRFYDKAPGIVQAAMDRFAKLTGRQYHLFDYVGDPKAERMIIMMGSGAEAAHEAIDYMNEKQGEKVGLLKVRLYRPFSIESFISAIPKTVKSIAVLDRTKEPGAIGEPLYQDVVTAYCESDAKTPAIIGGRYGLSSKEFTPAMVKGVLDELSKAAPKNHFTIGINDDVTNTSLEYDPNFSTEDEEGTCCVFIGLGSDGTVGANKNSIKIIGEGTDNYAQGYFVYDSKKSGSMTRSHLRFGKKPIRSTYLIREANFIACHQPTFVDKFDVLDCAADEAVFLLNSQHGADEVWDNLPKITQQRIIDKKIKLYTIDAYKVAEEADMGVRINTIMQTCFFAIANILPRDEAIEKIKGAIKKTFSKKGDEIVQKNYKAVDAALAHLHEVEIPGTVTSKIELPEVVSSKAPKFVREVLAKMMAGKGDELPVSAMPVDGTFPTATTQWEKRNIALNIPIWDKDVCIQCGKCSMVCPHGCIRMKMYDKAGLDGAPATFNSADAKGKTWPENYSSTVQVSPEDCVGCGLCVEACPAKNKAQEGRKAINLEPRLENRETEMANWAHFDKLPNYDRTSLKTKMVKESQLLKPLFEFSGACAGCGETAYVKLVTQLFGDRMIAANATGCSSIYGGNLPTTPYCQDSEGRGPTWSNSLFEDNAEFGLGMRLAIDKKLQQAREILTTLSGGLESGLADAILSAEQKTEGDIKEQRARVQKLKDACGKIGTPEAKHLFSLADYLVKKSVWIIGGDGWGYDIGYGGLDHVLASGRNVNVLLLDTEVYSNTGGQMSKSTPMGAVAKFAAAGKQAPKKDLGLLSMGYGTIYVAKVALGQNDSHTLKAIIEAEAYDGPSIILAYSHCIAHGYDLRQGLSQQKLAVQCGHWPLYRYNPDLVKEGKNPFQLDSKAPSIPLKEYIYNENRYRMLAKADPDRAAALAEQAQELVNRQWEHYSGMAKMTPGNN